MRLHSVHIKNPDSTSRLFMARILQICNTDFYLEKFLKPLVFELARRGHTVECLCHGRKFSAEFAERGITVHEADFPSKASPQAFWASIRALEKFLAGQEYDCINSHNRNASIVARIATWRATRAINLYTAHGMYFHDGQGKLSNWLTEVFEGCLARLTSHTLSQSDEDTQRMVARGHIARERIETIGNGINTEKFSQRRRTTLPWEKGTTPVFRIAALGRLVRGKGFESLLQAFHAFHAQVPDSELVFIGGNIQADLDSAHDSLQGLIRELGLTGQVHITGMVDNVEYYLAASDVFVHPSYREGMPRSLLEAMCMGLPVIATAIRGAREIIDPGRNGFLFPPGDSAELVKRLVTLHALPCDERQALGEQGRQLVLQKFDERAYVARQADAIDRLLALH